MRALAKFAFLVVVVLAAASTVPVVALLARPLAVLAAAPVAWYVLFVRPDERAEQSERAAEYATRLLADWLTRERQDRRSSAPSVAASSST